MLAGAKGSTEDAPAWRSNRAAKAIVQPVSMRSLTSNMGPEAVDTAAATSSDKLSRRHRSANCWALFARRAGGPSELAGAVIAPAAGCRVRVIKLTAEKLDPAADGLQ